MERFNEFWFDFRYFNVLVVLLVKLWLVIWILLQFEEIKCNCAMASSKVNDGSSIASSTSAGLILEIECHEITEKRVLLNRSEIEALICFTQSSLSSGDEAVTKSL